jgi:hypothetical protein
LHFERSLWLQGGIDCRGVILRLLAIAASSVNGSEEVAERTGRIVK